MLPTGSFHCYINKIPSKLKPRKKVNIDDEVEVKKTLLKLRLIPSRQWRRYSFPRIASINAASSSVASMRFKSSNVIFTFIVCRCCQCICTAIFNLFVLRWLVAAKVCDVISLVVAFGIAASKCPSRTTFFSKNANTILC